MMPEMDENLRGSCVPDVLAASLDLPVDDTLDGESSRVQQDGAYRTHGLGAEAAIGEPLTKLVGIIGEEEILGVEIDQCGLVVEGSALSLIVWDKPEGVDGECKRRVKRWSAGQIGNKRARGNADAGFIDFGRRQRCRRRGGGWGRGGLRSF